MSINGSRSGPSEDVKVLKCNSNISDESCQFSSNEEDVKTLWELMQRGYAVSNNGNCLGWRDSNSAYSWLTYGELLKRAEDFGRGLVKIGLISGQITKIGIYAQNCVEWVVAQYGIYSQSSIVVPLYDTLGANAGSFIVNQADLTVVVCDTQDKVAKLLRNADMTPQLKLIISVTPLSGEVKKLAVEKGIVLYLFNKIEELGVQRKIQNLGIHAFKKTDVMMSYLPLAHIFEQCSEAYIFLRGGCIGFFRGDVNLLVEDMKVLRPTYLPAVPRVLNKLYDAAQLLKRNAVLKASQNTPGIQQIRESEIECASYKDFYETLGGSLRIVLSAAAPISEVVLNFYRRAFKCLVMECYGQTECSGPCSLNLVTEDSIGNVGPPISCNMVKLVDVPDLEYFVEDNQGEVFIKGENLFKGYLKDPEKTLEALDADGWMRTGDIGMWLPNGNLKIIDRKNHIYKLAQGEYVSPEKIENTYLTSPYVAQIFVHGDSLENYLVAIIIPDKEAVMAWCNENLSEKSLSEIYNDEEVKSLILEDIQRRGKSVGFHGFEQVKAIHLHPKLLTIEEGFLTPTMKTKRAHLKKYFGKEIERLYNRKKRTEAVKRK